MHTKFHILCVDDNENNLFTLKALFEGKEELKVTTVLSGEEGLRVLLSEKIDLILLDIQMPQMNGFEFAKIVKANKKTADIPIVFLTAVFKSEEFIQEGYEIGAVDYLTKPIDDAQLLNKVSLYLKIFFQANLAKESEKKFYEITQSVNDGIFALDVQNRLTFINSRAEDLLGFHSRELMGKNIYDYIYYKDIDNNAIDYMHSDLVIKAKESEVLVKESDNFVTKEGKFLPVSYVLKPLYDDHEKIGTIVIFKDKRETLKVLQLEEEKIKNQEQIIHSMVDMIEKRDAYTAGHTKRVAKYSEMIARGMNYPHYEVEKLRKAAWLHDIGKISTPDNVLLKPAKLNDLEYDLIREHLNSGYDLLKNIDQYKEIAKVMREHHEKYDGSGYPRGLKADEISPLGRILIVADAFDAMTTNRIYKPRKSVEVALQELEELSAKHFHPEVVSVALEVLRDIQIDAIDSQLPKTKLEEQRFNYFFKDRLTDLFVIDYLHIYLRSYYKRDSLFFYTLKLRSFTEFNHKHSWVEGDKFLVDLSKYLEKIFESKKIFRIEGDDFLILSEEKIENPKERIDAYEGFEKYHLQYSLEETFIDNLSQKRETILEWI